MVFSESRRPVYLPMCGILEVRDFRLDLEEKPTFLNWKFNSVKKYSMDKHYLIFNQSNLATLEPGFFHWEGILELR